MTFNEVSSKILDIKTQEYITSNFSNENKIFDFVNQLNEKELYALNIAFDQLKSSFDIEKSIIYKKWSSK
jgi:predicted transcriptional regulator YheO